MKKLLLFICLFSCIQLTRSQTTTTKTLLFGGLTRSYIEHVPAIYNSSTPVPLIICLHGLGDNMTNFSGIGMNTLANTQNFIVLTPQAINSIMGAAWNSGASFSGMQLNANVDDLGFLRALIDTTMALYNIDPRRVYATGFSMGAFMCHRLACEMNNRIAAIASVAGTIGSAINCHPGRAVPVLHLQGTGDQTIFYTNNNYGMDAMETVMFWAKNNHCDTIPVITDVPDIAQDTLTIKHFVFNGGDNNTVVEHYRVDSAGHTWLFLPENDMSYTQAIWDFVSRFTLPEGMGIESRFKPDVISAFPCPASDQININGIKENQFHFIIYDLLGKVVIESTNHLTNSPIDIKKLNNGVYILKIYKNNVAFNSFKIIKQ